MKNTIKGLIVGLGLSAVPNAGALPPSNNVEVQNVLSKRLSNDNTKFISDTITTPLEEVKSIDYSFYKEKFDITNPEHLRIMNEPTLEELNSYGEKLEAAANDKQLLNDLHSLSMQANEIYENAIDNAGRNEKEFMEIKSQLLQIIKTGNTISAHSFDPINGFAGGPLGSCLSHHPALKLQKDIFGMIAELKVRMLGSVAKSRNESSGTLTANIQSMYTTSNFLSSVNTVMNGDPDMPQDLVANQARFETVASVVPSRMTNPSNPLDNVADLRNELETNGMRGGVNADVFHFIAKSNILGTGTSVNEFGVIGSCTDDIPNVGVHVGSSTNLPIIQVVAHELSHGIGEYNHTNTPDDIANNEIMRPVGSTLSNYWNQGFTINPFWEKVNQSDDCLNAAPALPVSFASFDAAVTRCETCPLGQSIQLVRSTASEVENTGFIIEISSDAVNFRNVGFVASKKPTSQTVQSYATAINDIQYPGTYYVRITDKPKNANEVTSSSVETVTITDEQTISDIFGNPGKVGEISKLDSDYDTVEFYNIQGQKIEFPIEENGSFRPTATGMYIVKVTKGNTTKEMKYIVSN